MGYLHGSLRLSGSIRRSPSSSRSPSATTLVNSPSRDLAWVSHRYSAGGRPDRTNRDHHLAASQGDSVPVVFVRRRLRGRPQFVRGVAKDGVPQALFAIVQCVPLPGGPGRNRQASRLRPRLRAGFYSGSQTISAAMGLSTDAINRLGLAADQAKNLLNSMPVAYAVTYMFGTVGSAIVIALLGRSCSALI